MYNTAAKSASSAAGKFGRPDVNAVLADRHHDAWFTFHQKTVTRDEVTKGQERHKATASN